MEHGAKAPISVEKKSGDLALYGLSSDNCHDGYLDRWGLGGSGGVSSVEQRKLPGLFRGLCRKALWGSLLNNQDSMESIRFFWFCGPVFGFFFEACDFLWLFLSDGMGSGRKPEASKSFIRKFLKVWKLEESFPKLLAGYKTPQLGGGFKSSLFFKPIWGRWTHFDEHIFQMGWNSTTNSPSWSGWFTWKCMGFQVRNPLKISGSNDFQLWGGGRSLLLSGYDLTIWRVNLLAVDFFPKALLLDSLSSKCLDVQKVQEVDGSMVTVGSMGHDSPIYNKWGVNWGDITHLS